MSLPLDEDGVIARYQTTRVRFLNSYKRIFVLTNTDAITLDPSNFHVTHTYPYTSLQKVAPVEGDADAFTMDIDQQGNFRYKCAHRSHLLCQLYEAWAAITTTRPSHGPYRAQRLRKDGVTQEIQLTATTFCLQEQDRSGRVLQRYRYYNFQSIGMEERTRALVLQFCGRFKIFYVEQLDALCSAIRTMMREIAIDLKVQPYTVDQASQARLDAYAATGVAIAVYDVSKFSPRHVRAVPRQFHITEQYLVERDISGAVVHSYRSLSSIYAIVRSWKDPRQFKIEYLDGCSVTYHSNVRDTLLAMLIDVTQASGNFKAVVTGQVSDGLRLLPRFAEEDYVASGLGVRDAFFGADSIEAWYLKNLTKVCERGGDASEVFRASKEFNANVNCPGISSKSDMTQVKKALSGLLRNIHQAASVDSLQADPESICCMLQSLYRTVPCVHGYKFFVETRDTDPRAVIAKLLRNKSDFVNYWILQVVMMLCRCPLKPRNTQQEFVNKQSLLTQEVLERMIDLLASSIQSDVEDAEAKSRAELAVLVQATPEALAELKAKELGDTERTRFPNSLVIVACAELLESVLHSKRDSTSPELFGRVINLLADRHEVLIFMLRSSSTLITENASILMSILLKNRQDISPMVKEAALTEGLLLRHFYSAVFSPSASQRYISRFLVSSWLEGPMDGDAKLLLGRLLPSGLLEYLKYDAISEDHAKNLDELEEEFYTDSYGLSTPQVQRLNAGKSTGMTRLKRRLSKLSKSDPLLAPANCENFRVMFHMITRDHEIPDLIWNEKTRLELRTSLDTELKAFDSEQQHRGPNTIAWNYQQFAVSYDSLKDEVKVGPIYLRFYINAGDAFIRTLTTPPPEALFEKLIRRVLGNLQRDAKMSTMCVHCLTRLYRVNKDIIGPFDDMMILVRMLDTAMDIELQHALVELLEGMCVERRNVVQLLDPEFVRIMSQLVTFSHLNPDQIGNLLHRSTNPLMITESPDIMAELKEQNEASSKTRAVTTTGEAPEDSNMNNKGAWLGQDSKHPKTWFIARPGTCPPAASAQRGPFLTSELWGYYSRGELTDDSLVAPSFVEDYDNTSFASLVDTGKWRKLGDYFQLRTLLMSTGSPIFSPSELSLKCLNMIYKVASLHRSANAKGLPFFPIPISKRLLSPQEYLATFAQQLLCNDPRVVEIAAEVLRKIMENNTQACSKLYLTGCFFFGARYTGNNFLTIAKLFALAHSTQSFHDSAASVSRKLSTIQRSVLNNVLPAAVTNILINYGPERFSEVFTGEFDTPEVIWKPVYRRHVVEMMDQHLGDFPTRLKQYTDAKYEYCPIPKILFEGLDTELYCHNYYLRNLCDEVRFPGWPIEEPIELLRATLERWREEMAKSIVNNTVADALQVLGLTNTFDMSDLRKSYRALARQYHPDKNPNGREMFERIQRAYELLSNISIKSAERNMKNVVLILKTQVIVYKRYVDQVKDQKYPAYNMVYECMKVPPVGSVDIDPVTQGLLCAGLELMYYSCLHSPLNGEEVAKAGCVSRVYETFILGMDLHARGLMQSFAHHLLVFSMKVAGCVCQYESARVEFLQHCPSVAEHVYDVLDLDVILPLAVENALEFVARGSKNSDLQISFTSAGVMWKAIPLLLAYDVTLGEELADETQRAAHSQFSANMHAVKAAKALGCLGGYMLEDLSTPTNPEVQTSLGNLLTVPLAKLLRNSRPWQLLGALNENCEKPTKIWNLSLRKELLDFVRQRIASRPRGTLSLQEELQPAFDFAFTQMRGELCVGGVYVRIFNTHAEVAEIEDPSKFVATLLRYIHYNMEVQGLGYLQLVDPSMSNTDSTLNRDQLESRVTLHEDPETRMRHLEIATQGLAVLAENVSYVAYEIGQIPLYLETAFAIPSLPAQLSDAVESGCKALAFLTRDPDFVRSSSLDSPQKSPVWRALLAACTSQVEASKLRGLWTALESFASHPEGLDVFLRYGGVVRMLGILCSLPTYNASFENRAAAATLLGKCVSHPVRGPMAVATLRRFLPEPIVAGLRSKVGQSAVSIIDTVTESPEVIWTAEMQTELRSDVMKLLRSDGVEKEDFSIPVSIASSFCVSYAALASELYIGRVYVRLYLKHPTFHLTNSVLFLEKLIEHWEGSLDAQLPSPTDAPAYVDSKALVLGKEDYLAIMTSCLVCLLKSQLSLCEHLISWGAIDRMIENLHRALDAGLRGAPALSIIRLLHQMVEKVSTVETLAVCSYDLMAALKKMLSVPLHVDTVVVVELLKKIFECSSAARISLLAANALRAELPTHVLTHIIGESHSTLSQLRNSSAVRVYAVDFIKALQVVVDVVCAAQLNSILSSHSAWESYRHQSHDLFLLSEEKTDYFLADITEEKFRMLLTDTQMGTSSTDLVTLTLTLRLTLILAFQSKTNVNPHFSPNTHTYPQQVTYFTSNTTITSPTTFAAAPLSSPNTDPLTSPFTQSPASLPLATAAPSAAIPNTVPTQSSGADEQKMGESEPVIRGRFVTVIDKSEHGLGLDLEKKGNRPMVKRLKQMPDGVPNPALRARPAVCVGDVIVGVNNTECETFTQAVEAIRASGSRVQLTIIRGELQP